MKHVSFSSFEYLLLMFCLSWFCVLAFLVFHLSYFVPFVLALGDAAAAGEGLAAGLELLVGVLSFAAAGELAAAGVGVDAPVVSELLAGSQAAAKAIENTATISSAIRLTKEMFRFIREFFIVFPHSNRIEKRDDNCALINS